jgi:serine/threonine-protein kinase RsbW
MESPGSAGATASIATVTLGEIVVFVPAHPRFVQILRSVVSAVAARLELGYDAIEDLKIAVDEASAQLLQIARSSGTLTLRVSAGSTSLEVVVSVDADVGRWPPDGFERSLTWQVLTGLTDAASWERAPEGPALRMVKRASASEGRR